MQAETYQFSHSSSGLTVAQDQMNQRIILRIFDTARDLGLAVGIAGIVIMPSGRMVDCRMIEEKYLHDFLRASEISDIRRPLRNAGYPEYLRRLSEVGALMKNMGSSQGVTT